MKTKISDINSFTRSMKVTILWDEIKLDFVNEFKKFRAKITLPGFRKGRVPEKLVKTNYGKSFEVDFVDKIMDKYFRQALETNLLKPINQAEIKDLTFSEGTDLVFFANFWST